jgi:hypothetical protein
MQGVGKSALLRRYTSGAAPDPTAERDCRAGPQLTTHQAMLQDGWKVALNIWWVLTCGDKCAARFQLEHCSGGDTLQGLPLGTRDQYLHEYYSRCASFWSIGHGPCSNATLSDRLCLLDITAPAS